MLKVSFRPITPLKCRMPLQALAPSFTRSPEFAAKAAPTGFASNLLLWERSRPRMANGE